MILLQYMPGEGDLIILSLPNKKENLFFCLIQSLRDLLIHGKPCPFMTVRLPCESKMAFLKSFSEDPKGSGIAAHDNLFNGTK